MTMPPSSAPRAASLPSWTVPVAGDADAPLRLFIFPFAGGSSVAWRRWMPYLPATWRTEFVVLPGREQRFAEPAFTEMAPLVDAAVAGLAPHLDRPFALYGHSMGAAAAYEVARRLEGMGHAPRHLFLSGRRAPGHPRLTPVIHHLPDEAFKRGLAVLGGTPREVLENDELMTMFLPLLRADFMLSDGYSPLPGSPSSTPATVFGGADDPETDRPALEAWRGAFSGPVRIEVLPGDHFFIAPGAERMIAVMQEALSPSARS